MPRLPFRASGRRLATLVGLGAVTIMGAVLMHHIWKALGQRPEGERLVRVQASPAFDGRRFHNTLPVEEDVCRAVGKWVRGGAPNRLPDVPVPVVSHGGNQLASHPASGLRATWFGHSSVLLEIDGHRILTDPVWSDRVSPSQELGSKRFYSPPMTLGELPELDAVVISHDHYDHLDMETVSTLAGTGVDFVVPLGVGSHLEYWGVEPARITELDWWQSRLVGELRLVLTPARHFSGRSLTDRVCTTPATPGSFPGSPRSVRGSVPLTSA